MESSFSSMGSGSGGGSGGSSAGVSKIFSNGAAYMRTYSNLNRSMDAGRATEASLEKAEAQAVLSRYQAKALLDEGRYGAQARRAKAAGDIGTLRAGFGRMGVDVNVGSPAAKAAEMAAEGDYEARMISHRANVESWLKNFEAELYDLDKRYYDNKEKSQKISGILDTLADNFSIISNNM